MMVLDFYFFRSIRGFTKYMCAVFAWNNSRNNPVYNTNNSRDKPVYNTNNSRNKPVYNTNNSRNKPVYNTNNSRNKPVYNTNNSVTSQYTIQTTVVTSQYTILNQTIYIFNGKGSALTKFPPVLGNMETATIHMTISSADSQQCRQSAVLTSSSADNQQCWRFHRRSQSIFIINDISISHTS